MSWVKIDDRCWSHPKMAALSAGAVKLWLWALCWCSQHETDGAIPRAILPALGGSRKLVAELVGAKLWEPTDSGWSVHDYLQFQPSKAARDEARAATRERVTRHRERSGNGVTPPVTTPVTTGPVRASARATRAGSGSGSGSGSPEGVQGEGAIRCPPDLRLAPEQVAALQLAPGIPEWAIEQMSGELVAGFVTAEPRTLDRWRRSLSTAICSRWSDPSRRPLRPTDEASRATAKAAYAARQEARKAEVARRAAEADARLRAAGVDLDSVNLRSVVDGIGGEA